VKHLEIIDEYGSGSVLMCEKCFQKYYRHIDVASQNGVAIIVGDTEKRGCVMCMRQKTGSDLWSGTMSKIWKGFKKDER